MPSNVTKIGIISPRSRPTELLERSGQLASLVECYGEVVAESRGRLVLVSGEAGIGKTSLLRTFCAEHARGARAVWGACDPLFTPRPLGPFLDVAEAIGGRLEEVVASGGTPYDVAVALAREFGGRTPIVVVLEDMHWADEASLDVLRLLARRIQSVRVLLLVSYRETELGQFHPMRQVLGELGSGLPVSRVRLSPLSPAAVAHLADRSGADAGELYRTTGGNPFFITEVLAAATDQIPETVRDAVLARAGRLRPAARALLEAVAVTPPQAELWLLQGVAEDALAALEESLASGMLIAANGGIAFRHELARLAIEEAITPDRKLALHRRALATLEAASAGVADLARLAHHAEGSAAGDAVVRFAAAAGARAASLGAHREAAAQYARALRFAAGRPFGERAALLERHSTECLIITQDESARASTLEALECYRKLGDQRKQGDQLSWLAQVQRNMGYGADAASTALEAVSLLEQQPPGHELAMAYSTLAGIYLLSEEADKTEAWAQRGVELARRLDDQEARITALQCLGASAALRGLPGGIEQLEHCLALAREAGLESSVGRIHLLLGMAACRERSIERMERYATPGLAYCEERDLAVSGRLLLGMHAWIALERGDWDRAAETAALVLAENCTLSCMQARIVLGLARARRGDPDCWAPLSWAREVATRTGQLFWMWQSASADAEAAWLDGRPEAIADLTASTFELAIRLGSPWPIAELAWWRRQGGVDESIPAAAGGPFALQLAGDWAGAAHAWRVAGCPYEAALALAHADADEPLRDALIDLQRLGARPAAAIVARRLRDRGARGLPRGLRPETRRNPANLTSREGEVLRFLTTGMRNAEIARRLVVSERTVDHHVSAILRKLGVQTRTEASAEAQRLGLPVAEHGRQ